MPIESCSTAGAIRINGSNSYTGKLQVCRSGIWKGVCSSSWSCDDAAVACRQLGFTHLNGILHACCLPYYCIWTAVIIPCVSQPLLNSFAVHYPYCCDTFGSSDVVDNTRYYCNGAESSLDLCSKSTTSSTCSTAGIYCRNVTANTTGCTHKHIRLVGSQNANEGRLEVCDQGTWSSICNIYTPTVSTVCRQLGYTKYGSECLLKLIIPSITIYKFNSNQIWIWF